MPHRVRLGSDNLRLLDGVGFVFLCVDDDRSRDAIAPELERRGLGHVDVGMGLFAGDAGVGGLVRTTTVAPRAPLSRQAVHRADGTIGGDGAEKARGVDGDVYRSRIQVADLNALNAALAVVSWKRVMGFYAGGGDGGRSAFIVGDNGLVNGAGQG